MTGRLVYEVRLRKTTRRRGSWRWDVGYYLTTDPEYPGVETGRMGLGQVWGYTTFKWQAKKRIADNLLRNDYKKDYVEV